MNRWIPIVALGLGLAAEIAAQSAPLARGTDIGWLTQLEARGVRWVDPQGAGTDPLALLKARGLDAVRLRVMVNPGATDYVTRDASGRETTLLGFCDPEGMVAAARRAAALGLRLMVNFHLADSWADPGKQPTPEAWRGLTGAALEAAVRAHVESTLRLLADAGLEPEWVQVGNEVTNGVLWPQGSLRTAGAWPRLAGLLNAGYAGVKAVFPRALVVVQLDRGYDQGLYRRWFDAYAAAGGRWDVTGLSFYPHWQPQGPVDQLAANLVDLAERYQRPVVLAEIGGLASDPEGTRALLAEARAAVAAVPGGRGLGIFYWEAASSPAVLPDAYPLGASAPVGADPRVLAFTSALDAWRP